MLQVIKFAEKVSFQSPLKCVSVRNRGTPQTSGVSLGLADPILWLIARRCDNPVADPHIFG